MGAGGSRLSDRSRSDGAVGCASVCRVDANGSFFEPQVRAAMIKTRIIVIVGFLIAFGAGAVVGLQLRTAPARATEQPAQAPRSSWLRTELGLTPEQN